MLYYKLHKQQPSDKFGVTLMKLAQNLDIVKYRKEVHFKFFYTTGLSNRFRYPKYVDFERLNIEGLIVERIERRDPKPSYALIQLHGGAYVYDYNDTYRLSALKYLKSDEHISVYSPIYSLAPKHPYPQALNEVINLYKYLLDNGYDGDHIFISGDSAGGGLALAVSLYLRDHNIPLPKAIITMSAWTNLAMNGESHKRNKKVDPMFGEGSQPLNVRAYTRKHDVTDPYISPKYGDYKKFTSLLMFVGSHELIESDTLDVAEKAKDTNEVYVHNFEGMFHVFPFGFGKMASSRKAWKIINEYLNDKTRGDDNG